MKSNSSAVVVYRGLLNRPTQRLSLLHLGLFPLCYEFWDENLVAIFIVLLGDTINILSLSFEEIEPDFHLLFSLRLIGYIFSSLSIFVGIEQNRHLISLEKSILVGVWQAPYKLEFCRFHSIWKGIVSIDFGLVNEAELLEPFNPSRNYLFQAFVHRF